MKIKGKFLTALTISFGCAVISGVTAASIVTIGYTATVPKGQSGTLNYNTASDTYTYALNQVNKSVGEAAIHTTLMTKYNGLEVISGDKIKLTGAGRTGTIGWKPTGVSANPTGLTGTIKNCKSGKNATEKKCIIKGSEYSLRLSNENLFSSYSIEGSFVMRD